MLDGRQLDPLVGCPGIFVECNALEASPRATRPVTGSTAVEHLAADAESQSG
jgi:hypothetical protein